MPRQQLNSYADVQTFFDDFITANQIGIDDSPHGAFWNTLSYDEFVNGDVPGVPGVKNLISGNSADSNLIKILKGPLTVGGQTFRRMPGGGPFMSNGMIASLADWIDRGCPNGAESVKGRHGTRRHGSFQPRADANPTPTMESRIHKIGGGIICDTDPRGYATPEGMDPARLVLDATDGFIRLWQPDTILRWRFRERSMEYFANPADARTENRNLFSDALLAWGTAAPVTFKYDEDLWDFELVMRSGDECNASGCVLAAAFFPDSGRHRLEMYPKMFSQVRKEQLDTFIHEIGHVFGLRHFFANMSETIFPSEIFGRHEKFSIMNYNEFSELTETDKEDLALLYDLVWNGELTHINGTPIRLFKPYSATVPAPIRAVACEPAVAALHPQIPVRYHAQAPRPRLHARMQSRSKAAYLDGE